MQVGKSNFNQKCSQTLLPSRHHKFLLSSCIYFPRNTWCVECKDKQLCKTDHIGSYFTKPNKVPITLRFLTHIPLKQMSFILKTFHYHIHFFMSTAPPRDFLNANLNLTFLAVYFIWWHESRISPEQNSVMQKNKRIGFFNGENITPASTHKE